MGLAHSPRIVTDGLVLCLDAANVKSYPGSGTTWSDLSGNGNNGTLVSSPTFDTNNGGSFLINSVGPYINLTQNSYGITDAYTVSFWVKRIGGTGVFLRIGQSSTSGMYFENYTDTDLFTWFFGANPAQNSGAIWGSTALSTTQWTFVTSVMTTSTKTQTAYINSVSKGSYTFPNAITAPSGTGSWVVKNNTQTWTGYITDIKIYNRALTAAEIQQNFNALRGRFGL